VDVKFYLADAVKDAANLQLCNQAFPKATRLLKAHQFRRVTKYGSSLSGKYLIIQVCESRQLKLGLTVSRKFGKAVKRNRFKRLVREAFRLNRHQLPLLHLNIRPSGKFDETLSLASVQQELLKLCQSQQKKL